MPRRSLVIEENQPSITMLLPHCPSCTKSECTKHDLTALDTTGDSDIEVTSNKQSDKLKKRKRKHRSSGSPKDKPNKKTLKKMPIKMAKPNDNNPMLTKEISTPLTPTPKEPKPIQLSPELEELERRLNNNMLQNIASSIEAALKPIKDSINKILTSSDLITKQEDKIKNLTAENVKLKEDLNSVRSDLSGFKSRLNDLENKALECNLIFRGLNEELNETEDSLKKKVYWNIADTIDRYDQGE